jgi:type IV secretion system protein VirD4
MQTDSKTRGQHPSYGQNTQRLGRELMTVSELTTMDGNKCILQLRGLRPFFSPKYDLKKHPNYRHTAEAGKKNAFDTATLFGTKLRAKPNDIFMVYEAGAVTEEPTSENPNVNEDIGADIFDYDDLDDPDAFA